MGRLSNHIRRSPGEQSDFENRRRCRRADKKRIQTLNPNETTATFHRLTEKHGFYADTSRSLSRRRCLTGIQKSHSRACQGPCQVHLPAPEVAFSAPPLLQICILEVLQVKSFYWVHDPNQFLLLLQVLFCWETYLSCFTNIYAVPCIISFLVELNFLLSPYSAILSSVLFKTLMTISLMSNSPVK